MLGVKPKNRFAAFEYRAKKEPKALRVLFEGDSWFDYPFYGDLSGAIPQLGDPDMNELSRASAGDTLYNMVKPDQLGILAADLRDYDLQALFLSGGGNDVLNVHLPEIIRDGVGTGLTPEDAVHRAVDPVVLKAVLTLLMGYYRRLFAVRDQHRPQCHIFTHGYDYIHPRDKGFHLYAEWTDCWVHPTLMAKGIPKKCHKAITDHLIDQFNETLQKAVADLGPDSRIHHVDLRGTLTSIKDWCDEIHPTPKGFAKLAGVYLLILQKVFPEHALHAPS